MLAAQTREGAEEEVSDGRILGVFRTEQQRDFWEIERGRRESVLTLRVLL